MKPSQSKGVWRSGRGLAWVAGLLLALAVTASAQPGPDYVAGYDLDAEAAFVEDLLGQMTVEEKLGQLTQYTGQWAVTGPAVPEYRRGPRSAPAASAASSTSTAPTTRAGPRRWRSTRAVWGSR